MKDGMDAKARTPRGAAKVLALLLSWALGLGSVAPAFAADAGRSGKGRVVRPAAVSSPLGRGTQPSLALPKVSAGLKPGLTSSLPASRVTASAAQGSPAQGRPGQGQPAGFQSSLGALSAKAGALAKNGVPGVPVTAQLQDLDNLFDSKGPAADVLASERPSFTAEQIELFQKTEQALSSAVSEAAAASLPKDRFGFKVQSRGSTARLTQTDAHADVDLMVKVEPVGTASFSDFMQQNLPAIKARLADAVRAKAAALFPGQRIEVEAKGPNPVNEMGTKRRAENVYLLPVKVYGAESVVLLDVDVTFTTRADFANGYPEYFAGQLEQAGKLGGEGVKESLLSDIRLAKRLFKKALHNDGYKPFYKPYHGGPGGVGVEQLVMQSGKTADQGRTVLEPGSFDKFMGRVLAIAYDQKGNLRGVEEARSLWTVHNPFLAPANFLTLVSDLAWKRLANAASNYAKAKAAGRAITFADLRHYDPAKVGTPDIRPMGSVEPEGVSKVTMELLKTFAPRGPPPEARGDAFLYAEGAKILPQALEQSWKARSAPSVASKDGWTGRGFFYRRDGMGFVKLTTGAAKEPKPIRVPDRLLQGILPDTVVELSISRAGMEELLKTGKMRSGIESVRSVGAYPADMMVGRVISRGGRKMVESLFSEDGTAKALYGSTPLDGGVAAQDGDIVQAFVKPAGQGFAAVPLFNLGRKITPEVAAREVALRSGARGYIDKAVIAQAEDIAAKIDPVAEFRRISAGKVRTEDLRSLPFITIDPEGAADLDDAYYVEKRADGGFTWYLATADVPAYVKPGTPAFKAAARIGNTFYSIDHDGVPAYPMNHPVVSQSVASLLSGKDSLAIMTKMSFDAKGEFLIGESDVFLALINVKGRYTYDQVSAFWKGDKDSGVAHAEQVTLARELASQLDKKDKERGKLNFSFGQVAHRKAADGTWFEEAVSHDPVEGESHRLIEELKVYGNRAIGTKLTRIMEEQKVPHMSRVHPPQEKLNQALRKELGALGLDWKEGSRLADFLAVLMARTDVSAEKKEVVQRLALRTRSQARYALEDTEGHEGLALDEGLYDHPSAPIRRFSDMYNLSILQAALEGADPRATYEAVLGDLKSLGFKSLDEYMQHLNGRQLASKRTRYEMDDFMALNELAKPANQNRPLKGYVKSVFRRGDAVEAVVQFRGLPTSVKLKGENSRELNLLDEVEVTVRGVDLSQLKADVRVVKLPPAK